MRRLDAAGAKSWCAERHIVVDRGLDDAMARQADGRKTFSFELPAEGLRNVDLSNWLLTLDAGGERIQSDSVLIWLFDWDIWSTERERVGVFLLAQLLRGEPPKIYPAVEYSSDELSAAQSLLSIVSLFQWDALLVPSHAEYLAHISHHGTIDVVARTPDVELTLAEGTKSFGVHRND